MDIQKELQLIKESLANLHTTINALSDQLTTRPAPTEPPKNIIDNSDESFLSLAAGVNIDTSPQGKIPRVPTEAKILFESKRNPNYSTPTTRTRVIALIRENLRNQQKGLPSADEVENIFLVLRQHARDIHHWLIGAQVVSNAKKGVFTPFDMIMWNDVDEDNRQVFAKQLEDRAKESGIDISNCVDRWAALALLGEITNRRTRTYRLRRIREENTSKKPIKRSVEYIKTYDYGSSGGEDELDQDLDSVMHDDSSTEQDPVPTHTLEDLQRSARKLAASKPHEDRNRSPGSVEAFLASKDSDSGDTRRPTNADFEAVKFAILNITDPTSKTSTRSNKRLKH